MTLLDVFSELKEFRADNHRYPLPHLVFIAVCMILCGADDWEMVSKLAKRKQKWLKKYIPFAKKIRSKGADYLLAVKDNHKTLHEDIKLFLDHLACQEKLPESASYHETLDKGHGRIEIRRCWVSTHVNWLDQRGEWKDLKMIGVVEGERHEGEKVSIERRYFISSLTTDAATFMSTVRSHWSVENNLHWSLDISFREDDCRIRKGHGAENMAVFRQVALNLLSQEKTEKLGMMNKRTTASDSLKPLVPIIFSERLLRSDRRYQRGSWSFPPPSSRSSIRWLITRWLLISTVSVRRV